MMSFLFSAGAFILLLLPLVIFHELGHFLFAKLFRVRADVFSIGFGPKLLSQKWGETEFCLSAIPLGGYVKLLGEDPSTPLSPEEKERSLFAQKPWKRFFIVFGGPLFNFILSWLLFMLILMIGEPHMQAVVGRVISDSVADQAGFQFQDQILKINETPIHHFEEIALILSENPEKQLSFTLVHPGATSPQVIQVKTVAQPGLSIYGESKLIGEIPGLSFISRSTKIGVSNPLSEAGKAGWKTGHKITSWDQKAVKTWEELELAYQGLPVGSVAQLTLENETSAVFTKKAATTLGEDWGIYSSELFVDHLISDSPAEKSGLQKADRILKIGNETIQSFSELKRTVQKQGQEAQSIQLSWEREGQILSATLTPTATAMKDPALNSYTQYTIGVVPLLEYAEPTWIKKQIFHPIELITVASQRVVDFIWKNLVSIKKMIVRDVSMGGLGGPITIGKMAGESLSHGLIAFLGSMAIFSIGLGVLNILPIPVLDGGHLVLLGIEVIRGRPLTFRQIEIIQSIGLALILMLMAVAFHNDISRLIGS